MKMYCLRCGCWTEFGNLTEKKHQKNTLIIRGECIHCGMPSCQIRGKSEVEKMRNEDKKEHEKG